MARGILTRQQILGTFCQESSCQVLKRSLRGVGCDSVIGPSWWWRHPKLLASRPLLSRLIALRDEFTVKYRWLPLRVLCHERRRSTRRYVTVREMKEGPSGSVIRSLIPSHRELLRSKAVVMSVAETSGQ